MLDISILMIDMIDVTKITDSVWELEQQRLFFGVNHHSSSFGKPKAKTI